MSYSNETMIEFVLAVWVQFQQWVELVMAMAAFVLFVALDSLGFYELAGTRQKHREKN